jgi:hypothetical protein
LIDVWLLAGEAAFFGGIGVADGSWLLFNYIAHRRLQNILKQRPKANA